MREKCDDSVDLCLESKVGRDGDGAAEESDELDDQGPSAIDNKDAARLDEIHDVSCLLLSSVTHGSKGKKNKCDEGDSMFDNRQQCW